MSRPLSFVGALALGALLAGGCFETDRVNGPVLGYETDPDACDDGRDNDRDGMIDCRDPGCIGGGYCGVIIIDGQRPEPENTFAKCTDRIDNDQDGNWDCGDRNCQAINELCCITEFNDRFCSDGFDNDENGFRDCGDFSCRRNPFVSVCDVETDCDDARDNDDDGDFDCADSDCAGVGPCDPLPPPEPEDTVGKCMDGVDNDRNSFTDCDDFSCSRSSDPAVRELCESLAGEPEDTLERCTDGIDNDLNGFIDCADFSCSRSTVPEIMEACPIPEEEDGFDECRDGIDNDEDGFPDCADFSCRDSRQTRDVDGMTLLVSPCQESITMTDPDVNRPLAIAEAIDRCSNRLDEDADGFTDCDDWDCQYNPLLKPPADLVAEAGRHPDEGYCQGWRYDRMTATWTPVPFDPDRHAPLLCRWTPRGEEEGL